MLDEILRSRKAELADTRLKIPLQDLVDQLPEEPPASFCGAITQPGIRIIAEIKYRSPSHGPFRCQRPPEEVGLAYQQNGAAAISVLTEKRYFDGDLKFLDLLHQKSSDLPLLRKDFIFDPYQVIEARVHGASAYLLIVACLSQSASTPAVGSSRMRILGLWIRALAMSRRLFMPPDNCRTWVFRFSTRLN